MKCPNCQLDSKKPDRPDGACPQCKRPFRLDPPVEGMSDYAVDALVKKITDNLAHKYVKRQLVAALERRFVAKNRAAKRAYIAFWVVGSFVLLVGLVLQFYPILIPFCVLLGIFSIIYFATKVDPAAVAQQVATGFGTTANEVAPRELQPARRGSAREFDLESYGFDRVIVVQGDDIAEMLVANQFHFQHNAAIISIDGYPQHVAAIVDQQLASNQATTVVLLHDASALGYAMAGDWLGRRRLAPNRVIRAGLSPRQAEKLGPKHPPMGELGAHARYLPKEDTLWLRTQSVTLASLKPSQIMTLLFNAIQRRPGEALAPQPGHESDYLIVGSDGGYDFGLSERPERCAVRSVPKSRPRRNAAAASVRRAAGRSASIRRRRCPTSRSSTRSRRFRARAPTGTPASSWWPKWSGCW